MYACMKVVIVNIVCIVLSPMVEQQDKMLKEQRQVQI